MWSSAIRLHETQRLAVMTGWSGSPDLDSSGAVVRCRSQVN